MKSICFLLAAGLALAPLSLAKEKPAKAARGEKVKPKGKGWVRMFNGKSLDGWKALENQSVWSVKDGAIVGDGDRSHLFWTVRQCKDCEFFAQVKLNHAGNSGMYFRAKMETGWPAGYEAQVNNTHSDWRRTGSLYRLQDVKEQLVPDDTWWTQHIIAKGNHIQVFVNDKKVVDHIDEKNSFTEGYLALQQHNKGSIVMYRNLYFRDSSSLPEKKKAR